MISQIYSNPSPKVKKLFQAVSELLEEGADPRDLKVIDITNRAGIGKGTAYEYFKSKEELIGEAQLYYFTKRFTAIQEVVKEAESFDAAIEGICTGMDGILGNARGVEVLLKHAVSNMEGVDKPCRGAADMKAFFEMLGQRAIDEEIIAERDMEHICNVLITELVGYGMACSRWAKQENKEGTIKECQQRNLEHCKRAIKLLLNS